MACLTAGRGRGEERLYIMGETDGFEDRFGGEKTGWRRVRTSRVRDSGAEDIDTGSTHLRLRARLSHPRVTSTR